MDDLEKVIRDEFSRLFEKDKEIEAVYKKIRQGTATYEEAHNFSLAIGKNLQKVLADTFDTLPENPDLLNIADIVERCLTQNYRLSSLVCETIQDELNTLAGVGMNPISPKMDKAKITAIKDAVTASDTPEALKNAVGDDVTTYTLSVVDDWVKTNAEFQRLSGMEPVIVRKWSGRYPSHDTKRTDWCKDLEGTWVYGEQPSRVFARHKGCTCSVVYYPDKKVKGRITALAKGEKDTNKVLWNTGEQFSNSRRAVLRRRRQMYGKEEARKMLNEEWKGGFNGNAERHF